MKKELGDRGEDIAAKYLQQQGYRIVQRNYRSRYGEVDIICAQQGILVFVEVKTRTSNAFGFPEESITPPSKLISAKSLSTIWTPVRNHSLRFALT